MFSLPTSTSGDYVLLCYIETPQVKSFTLPSLESHEVGEGEPGLKDMPVAYPTWRTTRHDVGAGGKDSN